MNLEFIKNDLIKNRGKNVRITVYGMRNKIDYYDGILSNFYPNIFTINIHGEEKSFAYRDIITKDIKINYK